MKFIFDAQGTERFRDHDDTSAVASSLHELSFHFHVRGTGATGGDRVSLGESGRRKFDSQNWNYRVWVIYVASIVILLLSTNR